MYVQYCQIDSIWIYYSSVFARSKLLYIVKQRYYFCNVIINKKIDLQTRVDLQTIITFMQDRTSISSTLPYNLKYMAQISLAKPQHAAIIADFQVRMAMETENIKLDEQLVRKAVEYFLSNSQQGKPSHLGFYLVKMVDSEVVGSLLVTFETKTRWWIQSVYVKQAHRRRNHFTSLFQRTVQLAKENKVENIKLYAENDNERAKATYFKLGMHIIEGKIYAYDFVLGSYPLPTTSHFKFINETVQQENLAKWKLLKKNLLGIQAKNNQDSYIAIEKEKKIVGLFTFFEQFSDWRFGIMRYVQELYLDEDIILDEVVPEIIKHLVQTSNLKVGAIRFILSEAMTAQMKGGHLEHYDILQIQIN